MNQIALPFDWPAPERADSFYVTDANRAAFDGLESPARWPVRAAILTGPRQSGRSLLGRIFAAQTGGTLVDDAEQHREAELFHYWNLAQEEAKPLVIIALSPPPIWKVRLPDLHSRLSATPVFTIGEPDETLMAMLLDKLLGQRGLQVTPGVTTYLLSRIERSYLALMRLVDALDSAALSQQKAVTIPLSRFVLQQLGMIDAKDQSD